MKKLSFLRHYLEPAFLICAGILAAEVIGMAGVQKVFGLYLKKEPLLLKKPLDSLDESGLGNYKVQKLKIQIEDVIRTLGTEKYIQWLLEDTNAGADSPVRFCMLFITYYDLPDIVPHVPEECYIGGDNEILDSEGMELAVSGENLENKVLVKYLLFRGREGQFQAEVKFPVFYLFNTNGAYTNSREGTRIELNKNIFSKYSYFSKVEWKFFNSNQFSMTAYPGKEESVEASKRLLGVILPKLESKYWPDRMK